MSHSKFFQQWHASLEAQAAHAYARATAPTPQTAGPSSCQESPSRFAQQWHAALEEQAQLALSAVNGSEVHNPPGAPVTTTAPTRQREIKRLFRAVEKELEHAPCIREFYTLLAEWRQLQNVSSCLAHTAFNDIECVFICSTMPNSRPSSGILCATRPHISFVCPFCLTHGAIH